MEITSPIGRAMMPSMHALTFFPPTPAATADRAPCRRGHNHRDAAHAMVARARRALMLMLGRGPGSPLCVAIIYDFAATPRLSLAILMLPDWPRRRRAYRHDFSLSPARKQKASSTGDDERGRFPRCDESITRRALLEDTIGRREQWLSQRQRCARAWCWRRRGRLPRFRAALADDAHAAIRASKRL